MGIKERREQEPKAVARCGNGHYGRRYECFWVDQGLCTVSSGKFTWPPMTNVKYKAALKALGLSQERAGDWLGIGKRTSQGYALGERPVPEPVAKLLRLCVKLKLKPEDVK